ncbi:hypothetical protein [Sulfurovum riftiae]|uniref:Prenylated flavin chaperone LpdD-like domain-containing protein n=1 Tax=Sulfurovum riftiae TaxID=1630136 RepID=A0A151CGW8_9BACT|nr:hypothetical protein [Sulfurovum riftiae]KYJ86751.1 hypothetical protein AS592_07950 [Sulfurovum riftiae]
MITVGIGRYAVHLEAYNIGNDRLVIITGGEEAHIGSASLAEAGQEVRTISKKGHKDHVVSEKVASFIYDKIEKDTLVVCGIHIDHATPEEIGLLVENAQQCVAIYLKEKQ